MVLAAVSYLGPMLEIKALTMITAFGIACVKAFLVIKHFMHLTIEKRPVGYFLITAVAFMFLFYAGVSPDVMEHEGRNWVNVGARNETARALAAHAAGGGHGEHGGHGDHAAPAAATGHEGHEAHGEHAAPAPAGH